MYGHDNEHQKQLELQRGGPAKRKEQAVTTGHPFAGLKDLLGKKQD